MFLGDIASGKKRGLCVSQGSQFEVCMFPRKIHTHECLGMHVSHKHTYSLLSRYVCVPQTYIPYVRGLRNMHTREFEICMVRRNIPTHNIPVCMFPTQIQTVSCLMYIRSQKHTHRGGMSAKQRLPSSMYFPCNNHALDLEGSIRRKRYVAFSGCAYT